MSYNQGSVIQYVLGQIVKLGTLVNQFSWMICTIKQLKLKPSSICMCNTSEVLQGFMFHEFGHSLYHEILEI